MKFLLTMNMGSANNNLVHLITCTHPSESLEEFADTIAKNEFIIVDEFYINSQTDTEYSRGSMIINTMHIGKVKVYMKYQRNDPESDFRTSFNKR